MATATPNTPVPTAATAIQHLMPRFNAIRGALDALEPLMLPIAGAPSPLYNGLQTIFSNLQDELDAVGIVICALHPVDMTDLAAQAAVVRYRYSDGETMDDVSGPLGDLLGHIDELAA